MDIAKEKQGILDYVTGLQDSAAVQDLKNFIALMKEKQESKSFPMDKETISTASEPLTEYKTQAHEEAEYELTEKGLKILEERRQAYLNGEKILTEEEANNLAKKWL